MATPAHYHGRSDRGPNLSSLREISAALLRLLRRYGDAQRRHFQVVLAVQILYVVLFGGWLIYSHTWPAPDLVVIFLLVFALLAARGISFLRDWSPFMLLLLAYIALTGIEGGLVRHVHEQFPINADRTMFAGQLPTTWLQTHLWHPPALRWYDYVAAVLYPMHFLVPLVVAFGFWMWKREFYWKFVAAYLLLTYAGFVTYVLYPMAPPWWAANDGRIPAVAAILDNIHFGVVANPIVLATQFFRPNPVAAMPSIHAAFPVLVWLVLWRVSPRWGWLGVFYAAGMSFSVVYLGEHYVIDVIAGWLYAVIAFAVVWSDVTRIWRRPIPTPAPATKASWVHAVPDPSLARPTSGGYRRTAGSRRPWSGSAGGPGLRRLPHRPSRLRRRAY
jgi:membrane-associated phospholipid phosphatase